jgi:hypothetical protein
MPNKVCAVQNKVCAVFALTVLQEKVSIDCISIKTVLELTLADE